MAGARNKTIVKKELIDFMSSLGLKVNTVTKARGNKGFFKEGRIDISKNLDDVSSVRTLIHEYAHYVNYRLDKNIKDFEVLFCSDSEKFRQELQDVTNYVDENALCGSLFEQREKLKVNIKNLTKSIRQHYPEFKPNKDLPEYKRYTRWSDAGYLEKYDRVKIYSWFSSKVYSISNVRVDFPDMPEVFIDYLKLKSKQRKRAKISRKITKMNKYYSEPCELFARFIEGLYLDFEVIKNMAPHVYERFLELYNQDYYFGLRQVFEISGVELF